MKQYYLFNILHYAYFQSKQICDNVSDYPVAVARSNTLDIDTAIYSGYSLQSSKRSIHDENEETNDNELRDCFPTTISCHRISCMRHITNYNNEKWINARMLCLKIVSHSSFEWIVLILIIGSSTTLCFEDVNLEKKPTLKLTLFILNNVFTFMFVIEMFLKWMALGLHKYFTSFWTLLDVFIIVVSLTMRKKMFPSVS